MTGVERLVSWNEARCDYEWALEKKLSKRELQHKWNAAQSAFAALTGIEDLEFEEQEMEFCDYMREWHEDLRPPFVADFERACRGG